MLVTMPAPAGARLQEQKTLICITYNLCNATRNGDIYVKKPIGFLYIYFKNYARLSPLLAQ